MFADTLQITYNAVAVTLNRITEANFSSTYYGESSGNKYTLEIKHTIPRKGATGESHVCKLSVEYFDGTTGAYLRTEDVWTVVRTTDAAQNSTTALRSANALVGLTTSAFMQSLIARQS